MSNEASKRTYPQRVLAFYEALVPHLERRYTAYHWSLCLHPEPGAFPHIQGFDLPTHPGPRPFANPCFLSIVWWGDELTAINASLMFDSLKHPDNLDNKTFNLSDPPFLVSAYLDALVSTPINPSSTPNIDAAHQWDAYDRAQARARALGGFPAFLPTPSVPRPAT